MFIVGLSYIINLFNYDLEKDEEDGFEKEISEGIKIFFKSCFLDVCFLRKLSIGVECYNVNL